MRRCFRSKFRLFRDRPDIITPGRWVRVPWDTPHYPGPHWYGSRDWTSDERDPWPELGEVEGNVRLWDGGAPAGALAPPVLIGRPDCIEKGDRWPLPVLSRNFATGWDSRCYPRGSRPSPGTGLVIDVRWPAHQQFLAATLAQFYSDPNGAAAALQAWMGPGAVVTVTPNSGSLYPGTLVGVHGNQTVVLISGTSNYQQLALQGMVSGLPPQSTGVFSTSPLWWGASNVIANRIYMAGGDPNGPIIYAGHSYGGAVATVLTARTVYGNPTRPVQLFTIGSPPAGGTSLFRTIANVPQVNLINEGDPIGNLPPDIGIAGMLGGLLTNTLRANWNAWARNPNVITLTGDGTQVPGPDPTLFYGLILQAVTQYLLGQPITPFAAHGADVYAARLGAIIPPENDVLPGTIVPYAGPVVPAGYVICDGSEISRSLFAQLFLAIGTIWGAGNGVTTFNVPDLRGRTLIGAGAGPGLTPRLLGTIGGEESHTLSVLEMPVHNHGVTDPGHIHTIAPLHLAPGFTLVPAPNAPFPSAPVNTDPATTGIVIDDKGGGLPHENMQPWACTLWLIKT